MSISEIIYIVVMFLMAIILLLHLVELVFTVLKCIKENRMLDKIEYMDESEDGEAKE